MCITQDIYATNVLKMELLRDEDEESESNINNTRVGQQLNSYDIYKLKLKIKRQLVGPWRPNLTPADG